MLDRHPDHRPSAVMPWQRLLETVRYEGVYPTAEHARDVTLRVLGALGRQLTGEVRVDLAARLPVEAAVEFSGQVPAVEPLTGWGFVKDLAERGGGSLATARWDAGTVLTTLARALDRDLLTRIIDQLPDGYALLFGQAQLKPRPAARDPRLVAA
ncbi:DUF2267 domain-containing protein [Streptomyces solincola]|uniref:DUF2267 domain-containing protein n=1 Tax=Streptomyces solincola TaxID=2100817 RepID=A0A2S9PVF4_9ACTN|nr:DUF2267 domain-containing protein [Streptomyces solincola]PRH78317.1 DUF2267 domain-containing protein [Streptomyces solincola]